MLECVPWDDRASRARPTAPRAPRQGGAQGRVRTWVAWPEAGLLLLNMANNRWCGNVGRALASNGVFYVVDLQARLAPTPAPTPILYPTDPYPDPNAASNGVFYVVGPAGAPLQNPQR